MCADIDSGLVAGTATAVVLGALAPLVLRAPAEPDGDRQVLRVPKAMRWLLWFAAVGFAALLVALCHQAFVADDAKARRTLWLAVPILLVLVVGGLREARVLLTFDEHGVGGTTAWRGARSIKWADVASVRWSNLGFWMRLEDRRGEVLRVSGWLQGFQVFVERLVQELPPAVFEGAVGTWRRRMRR